MSTLALSLIQQCLDTQNPYLDLGNCGLTDALVAEGTDIDIALRKCTHLKTLILSNDCWDWKQEYWIYNKNKGEGNYFAIVPPAIQTLVNLMELRFSGAHYKKWTIKEIDFVSKLTKLITLDISYNQITELKGLDNLTNLQYFCINSNQITELKGLDKLTNLQYFYITDNQITELKGLDKLTKLQYFKVRNNQITDMQYLTSFYKKGVRIDIYKNPINYPPLEIFNLGSNSIVEWFESNQLYPLNECKLLFVGDGGVGKTSLMRRVMGEAFNDKESTTHGINKIAWKEIQNAKGEEIRVNLWDFGGQHIQHSLHQFFFTQRVIYVLVLDPRNDNNAYYWLEQIEKLGCDSEVIIVHNWREKKDIQANYLGNFYELRKKYPRLPEPFLLSCKTEEGLPEFKEKLKATILAQKDLTALYPEKWYNIKRELEETTEAKDYIRYESYEEICDKLDYKDEERQRNLLKILDDIGAIVFFNEPILNHLQVLNPDWITTGAYTILTSGVTSDKKGHLKHADLKAIFQAEIPIFSQRRNSIKYKENQFDFILHLMLKFDLCQRNPFVENEYLVPAAFDGKQTQDYSDFKKASKHYRIQFSASFEMIIMHKFIARNIAKCVGRNYWASGLHLKDAYSQTFALVETEQYSQLVNFWIQGENIVGFWQLLSNDMKDICKNYHNFKLEEQVYYQKKGKEAFLSYQEMLKCAQKGISVLPYHPTYDMEDINVQEVLSAFQKPLDRRRVLELIENGNFVEVFKLLDRQDMSDKYLYNRLKKEYKAGAQGIELMEVAERLKTLVNDLERRG